MTADSELPSEAPSTPPADPSEADPSEGEADPGQASEASAEAPPAEAAPESAPSSAPPNPKESGAGKSLALIFITVALVAAIVVFLPRKVDLIVDNGLGAPIRIFVNGKDRGRIEPHDNRVLSSVPAGPVVLTGHELGPEGQEGRGFEALEGELSAPLFRQRRRAYIWNVEGKTEGYWITTHGYGDQSDKTFKPEAYVAPGPLFVIPGRCEPLLNDVPKQVRVKGSNTGTTRDVLFSSHRVQRILMEKKAREMLGGMQPLQPGNH
tara:strand:+ start:996 stop:1790 length:795 start_codon:yes stop_codon:yes gene_type:complete